MKAANQYVEIFDSQMLKHIVKFKSYYKTLMSGVIEKDVDSQFKLYEKYLQKAKGEFNNMIVVNYKRPAGSEGKGRLYAGGSLSLQSFHKLVRGSICGEYYYDIDMCNAHPTILLSICMAKNMFCVNIKAYVENRNEVIEQIIKDNPGEDTDSIKKAVLSAIYGGFTLYKKLKKNTWLEGFKKEIDEIYTRVPEWFPETYKKKKKEKKYNWLGSTLSSEICIVEDKMLKTMVDFLKKSKLCNFILVLCFDGVMIEKKLAKDDKKLKDVLLNIEKLFVKEHSIPMKLKIKEFSTFPVEVPEEYIKECKNNTNDNSHDVKKVYRDDEYYWYDFIEDTKKVYDSFVELKLVFKNKIRKVMLRVYTMDNMIIRKIDRDNMYQIDKRIPSKTFHYSDISPSGKVVVKSIKLSKLLEGYGFIDNIPTYNGLTFRPIGAFESGYVEPERVFNTWNGFQAKLVNPAQVDMNKINPILNHIKKVWCSDNVEHYNYMISWFKCIFINPSFKSKVAIVLKSTEKQIGKGIIINDFLIPYVFGNQSSMSVAGLDTITSKFNQIVMNKVFINCDELSTLDGSFHQSFDVLKKRITDKTIKIEIKGGKSFVYPDYSNYIMCTNNDFTIKIEDGDVRYCVLECSPCYKKNFAYFRELADTFNQDTANHFYTYVSYLQTDIVEIRNVPITNLKKEMIISGFQSPRRFLLKLQERLREITPTPVQEQKELVQNDDTDDDTDNDTDDDADNDTDDDTDNDTDYNTDNEVNAEDTDNVDFEGFVINSYRATGVELYQCYLNWCEVCNEKKLSTQKFGRDIKYNITKSRSNAGVRYHMDSIKFNFI